MMFSKYSKKIGFVLILFIFIGINSVYSKNVKKVITIDDIKLWRNHSVTLSDNGEWYTVLYKLTEKPDPKEEPTKKPKKDTKKTADIKKSIYGKNALTDVLYIRHTKSKKEYQIPKGTNPLFSPYSDWVVYSIKSESKKNDKTKPKQIIELKNLVTGKTKKWESNASYQFTKDGKFFVSSDKTSILLFNLSSLKEHYIGSISEYLLDKKSNLVAYTIDSKDKRGNGIYLYNLETYTTKALETGNYHYSRLTWNQDKTSITALKYKVSKKKKDPEEIRIICIMDANSDKPKLIELKSAELSGIPKNMRLAVKNDRRSMKMFWSIDNKRIFVTFKKKAPKALKKEKNIKDDATVNVWHWKDKKLISQQMLESKREKNKTFIGVLNIKNKKIFMLTGDKIQNIIIRKDTDKWAIGMDNRNYISDWDVYKNDIYRINLINGEKKLILKNHTGNLNVSPEGERAVFWKDGHYWYYNFNNHTKNNITAKIPESFLNREHDYYGSNPAYGFVGWTKDLTSIVVNHKLDLWKVPLDDQSKAINLTKDTRGDKQIRFRFDDMSFFSKPEMKERYINLKAPIFLNAFNIKTKYYGYYQLSSNKLKKLIYKPVSFSNSRWRRSVIEAKKSDAIVFKMGDYKKYPESYLSNDNFSKPKKITSTNPQQSDYKWGHRILIDYKNDDGVPLQGVLSIPDGYKKGQKLPMMVYTYEKLSANMYRYPSPRIGGASISEMMYVSDGYLFLQPDIHFNVGTPHSDMHECIDAAIRKVIELGYVDEKRIGYEGFSFGGHCGMFVSTQNNKFAAIAAGAGVSNLIQGFNIDIVRDGSNEQDYYMTQQGRLGANPTEKPEMYARESAVFNAKNMNTPLLLFHGTADSVVKWEHSFGLYSILRFLKKPVIFLSYRGEGHGLRQKANRFDINTRLKEYFDHYLKSKKAPEWIVNGLPFKAKPDSEKKKGKVKPKRTVPDWK